MSISSLFAGMEAYLDGDVEINNNVSAPEGDAAEDAEIANQTAEVASDTADATEEAKDTEVASQMLSRMCDMYDHVKQFGIDRTFVSLYNRHGELDRVCGMRFPSCESMDVVGDRYSMYSTAFIAAMESSGSGLWAKIKAFILNIWKWIKEKASLIWKKIKALFGFKENILQKALGKAKGIGSGIMGAVKGAFGHVVNGAKGVGGWIADHKVVATAVAAAVAAVTALMVFTEKLDWLKNGVKSAAGWVVDKSHIKDAGQWVADKTAGVRKWLNDHGLGKLKELAGAAKDKVMHAVSLLTGLFKGSSAGDGEDGEANAGEAGESPASGKDEKEALFNGYPYMEADDSGKKPFGLVKQACEKLKGVGGAIYSGFEKAIAMLQAAYAKLVKMVANVANEIGDVIGPVLNPVAAFIQKLYMKLLDAGKKFTNIIGDGAKTVLGFLGIGGGNDEISKAIDGAVRSADIAAMKRGDVGSTESFNYSFL